VTMTKPFTINGVEIRPVLQDITTLGADVIVSSSGTGDERMSRGVSQAIRRTGGKFYPMPGAPIAPPGRDDTALFEEWWPQIKIRIAAAPPRTDDVILFDLRKHSPFRTGSVVVTTAGQLRQVKYIFHAVIIDWSRQPRVTEADVRQATAECIRLADALGVRSLALPALGAGPSGGADPYAIARAMVETVFSCLEQGTSLKLVYFADIDPERFEAFRQSLEATSHLPPQVQALAQQIGQVRRWNVHFNLTPATGGYDVTLDSTSGLAIELSRSDVVADLNRNFVDALNRVRKRTLQAGTPTLSPENLQAYAEDLIDAGQQAFNETFKPNTPIRQTITGYLSKRKSRDYLLALTIRSSSVEHFPLIWEMLYDTGEASPGLENQWGLAGLWGSQFAVARETWSTARPIIDPYMSDLTRRGGMLLLAYDKLKNVKEIEVPGLLNQAKQRTLPCRRVDQVLGNAGTRPTADDVLKALTQNQPGYDFLHFACHAEVDPDRVSNSRLRLLVNGQEVTLTYRDLSRRSETWESHPLVFLNACSSAEQAELQTRSLVSFFLDRGARGVIATECVMPDVFAAHFALKFYELFFQGLDIDQALLETRRYFLKQHHNPLGLAYTLYAHPDTRVEW
jgi:O-acetyl-ADP-ribose deacetylase (regulator of RNase III)